MREWGDTSHQPPRNAMSEPHKASSIALVAGHLPSPPAPTRVTSLLGTAHDAEKATAPTPVLLPGESHGGGAWWAAVHGVAKSRTRLSDLTFTFHFHALEKEMATHSSVLAWRIPGTGEPGGLPSMGSHRVGHD